MAKPSRYSLDEMKTEDQEMRRQYGRAGFRIAVLSRYMTSGDIKEMVRNYNANLKKSATRDTNDVFLREAKEVYELFMQGLTSAEIKIATGLSEHKVNTRLVYALDNFRVKSA